MLFMFVLQFHIEDITLKQSQIENKPHINTISSKIFKNIVILYRARLIIPIKQSNQLYFSFVHSHSNYENLAQGSTQKIKLSTLYRQQWHSIRLLSLQTPDLFFKEIGALNIHEINILIFHVSCLNAKTKLVPNLSKSYLP